MALVEEYKRSKGLEGFSLGYYNFFDKVVIKEADFKINQPSPYKGLAFFFEGYFSSQFNEFMGLSPALFIACNHGMIACQRCIKPPSCKHDKKDACLHCFKDYSSRGLKIVNRNPTTEKIILELADFAYNQKAWIKHHTTRNQIRQNSNKVKAECQKRLYFFVNKLYENKNSYLVLDIDQILEFIRQSAGQALN